MNCSRTCRRRTTRRRPASPRSSSAPDPTSCCSTSSTTSRAGRPSRCSATNYLAVAHNEAEPIDYPYFYIAPSNTGVPSGFDLDNDGIVGGPDDAFGFGDFPGQYGMVVLSRFPIVDRRRAHVPERVVGVDAGRSATRRPDHPRAGRLLLARGVGGRAAVVEVALGRARRRRWPHRPCAGRPPDAPGVRRTRGPQRPAQRRRDPVLGRLRRRSRHRLDRR